MAFRKVGQLIKTLLTVLGALTMGFFFLTGMNETRDGWFLFGLIFGVFLIYGLIQLIYCLDIRRVFAEWPFLLVSLLLTLCIAACFRMDVTGYDSYLPKAEEIESIGLSRGDETPNYFGYYYRRVQNGVYYGSLNDRIEYMNLPADDLSYSLLSRMVEETLAIRKKSFYDSPDVWGTEQPFYESVHVKLKNGKDYYRSYRGRLSAVDDLFIELYDCPEFVDAVYITNLFQEEDVINIGVLLEEQILRDEGDGSYSWQYEHRTNLAESREDIRRLKEAVLKDSQSLRPETVKEEVPVGILYMELDSEALMRKQDGTDQEKTAPAEERGETVSSAEASSVSAYYPDGPASMFRNTEESHFPVSFCAYIYSTFTETLQELEKQGILYSTMPDPGQIQEILVFPAEGKEWSVTAAGSVSPAEGEERPAAATEEIEELYKRFVPDFLNTRWTQARDRAEIRWTDKEGKKRGSSGVLRDIAG
ncbi:MAG: hypothetical protein IIY55_08940 [Blautia sp.]|nr:hypothetical protein [Blautia sp.]